MLSADHQTFDSLRSLWGLARGGGKPILVWVGAGASSWLGYERWGDLAQRFHSTFLRAETRYQKVEAAREIEDGHYADLFQKCREANAQRYHSLLADSFRPKHTTPVYKRFITALRAAEGTSIVTTNIDECLERSLPDFDLVQRSDLQRTISLLSSRVPFIAKLHGSVSAIQSAVFTSSDYEDLTADQTFIHVLRTLLTTCSVVFIGYSMRDQYLFNMLAASNRLLALFGDGPHFLVTSDERLDLPDSVKIIRYRTDRHTDHRSGILSVEVLHRPSTEVESLNFVRTVPQKLESAYFLSDLYPAGTWRTQQRLELAGEDGGKMEMHIGPDWSIDEFPDATSTAAYDFAVGLLCFDQIVLPIDSVGLAHQAIGSEIFWQLIADHLVRFVHWEGYDSVVFLPPDLGYGHLATGKSLNVTTPIIIRRNLQPSPGKEAEAEARFSLLEGKTRDLDLSGALNFADVCNGLFVSPTTRKLLGLSEGTPVGNIPRWAVGPVLRVVHIARIGATCQMLNLSSMKIMTGAAPIAQVAFSAVARGTLARDVASYTLSGQFGVIPEDALTSDVWRAILRFRDSAVGVGLRAEIGKRLRANDGAEIEACVNASMREALPARVLAQARAAMSALLIASTDQNGVTPAIWSDARLLWNGPVAWRRKAAAKLKGYLESRRLGPYDLCPCGSCDKVKFCCQLALVGGGSDG